MSPLSKEDLLQEFAGIGISKCIYVGRDFLKCCTLSNEQRIQNLLIIGFRTSTQPLSHDHKDA